MNEELTQSRTNLLSVERARAMQRIVALDAELDAVGNTLRPEAIGQWLDLFKQRGAAVQALNAPQ